MQNQARPVERPHGFGQFTGEACPGTETGMIPLSERWWLLPRFRPDHEPRPWQNDQRENIAKIMRQRPLSHAEAAAHRDEIRAA